MLLKKNDKCLILPQTYFRIKFDFKLFHNRFHWTLPGQATSTGSWVTGHKVLQEGPFIGLPAEWKVPLQSLHDGGRVGQGKALTQQLRMGSKYLKSNDKNIKININIPYTKGSLFSTCFSFLMIFMFY